MKFLKYSALGNTFVVVPVGRPVRTPVLPWVRALCHPETGVAADGAALLETANLRLHIYNADGTRAEVSGNGARCAAQFLFEADASRSEVVLKGDSGSLLCRRAGRRVEVTLPPPVFAAPRIPARTQQAEVWGLRLRLPKPSGRVVTLHALSVGNPQCVLWGRAFPRDWEELGALLHTHRMFPERTNVVFAKFVKGRIEVNIWERGVGPTRASGTGAAAAAVVGARLGISPRRVEVAMAGGTMRVVWKDDQGLALTAPAERIAEGHWSMRRPA